MRFNVTGLVRDEKAGTPIQGSVVQLIASDGSNLQAETGTGGDFRFALKQDVDYIFLASKERLPERQGKRNDKKHRKRAAIIWLPFS